MEIETTITIGYLWLNDDKLTKKWVAVDDIKRIINEEQFKGKRDYCEGCARAIERIKKEINDSVLFWLRR